MKHFLTILLFSFSFFASAQDVNQETAYSLVSSENRLVFNDGGYNSYEVYYFTAGKLVKLEQAEIYPNEQLAIQYVTQRNGDPAYRVIEKTVVYTTAPDFWEPFKDLDKEEITRILVEDMGYKLLKCVSS